MATVTESPTKTAPPETQEALTLFAQGKRHLLVKDISEAVSCLGKACELLASHYGEEADECGDAYFHYGRALLELARSETGVLGDALGDENEDSSEEDEEEETDENAKEEDEEGDESEKKEAEKDGEVENASKADSDGDKVPESESKEDESGKKDAAAASSSSSEAVPGPSSGESAKKTEGNEEDLDDTNLKLAWEMLELSKLIFQRQQDNKVTALKLADVHLLLGEVGLESEVYDQAIEDMRRCLDIQIQQLEPDDRRIAETHYQLGVAYGLQSMFDAAMEQFSRSVEVIEKRIKNLEVKKAAGDKPDESDAFYTVEGEITELRSLLPEMKDKVAEMKEAKCQMISVVSKMMEDKTGASEANGSAIKANGSAAEAAPPKPVSNISHLVRKKRKAEDGDSSAAAAGEDGKGTKSPEGELPAKMKKMEQSQ